MPNDFKTHNRQSAKNTKELLSSGFLNGLGSNKQFLANPIEFDALESVLVKYGALFVKGFSSELDKQDITASGALDSSLRFEFTKLGNTYETSVYMSDYAKFVDEGVQGINPGKSKNITSQFKFKFSNPSKKHVEALEKWIKQKNVVAIITVPKGIASKKATPLSLAQAIGYNIKQRGLRATYFKKKVVESLIDDFKKEVAIAAGIDMKVNVIF
jgi:hypothetical protein